MAATGIQCYNKCITEARAVNNIIVFSGTEQGVFPGMVKDGARFHETSEARHRGYSQRYIITKTEELDITAHNDTLWDSREMMDMYDALNSEVWWLLTVKTSGFLRT